MKPLFYGDIDGRDVTFLGIIGLGIMGIMLGLSYYSNSDDIQSVKVYRSNIFKEICDQDSRFGMKDATFDGATILPNEDSSSPFLEICGKRVTDGMILDLSPIVDEKVNRIVADAFDIRKFATFSGEPEPFEKLCTSFFGKTVSVSRINSLRPVGDVSNRFASKDKYACVIASAKESDVFEDDANLTYRVDQAMEFISLKCSANGFEQATSVKECFSKELADALAGKNRDLEIIDALDRIEVEYPESGTGSVSKTEESKLFEKVCAIDSFESNTIRYDWKKSNAFIGKLNSGKKKFAIEYYDKSIEPKYYDPSTGKISTDLKFANIIKDGDKCLVSFVDSDADWSNGVDTELVISFPRSSFKKSDKNVANPLFDFSEEVFEPYEPSDYEKTILQKVEI